MKASETTVLKLLQGSKVFIVPTFQRRYSWRAREWELLWADLVREYGIEHDAESQVLDGHFLGSIVLHPAAGAASTLMRHLVIDGQQRLTTILVVLAAIRDLRAETGWNPNEYDSQFLTNPYESEYPDRLLPTKLDRESYTRTVREHRPTEGIGQAYEWFSKRIRDAVRTDDLDLARLGNTLLLHMLLVEINTTPGDSVNNIFNTLNSKGMPLSASDLVRNELLLHVGEARGEQAHDEYWLPMELALVQVTATRIIDREFVTFLWSREVVADPSTTRLELFPNFERRLRKELESLPTTQRQAKALEIFKELYEDHRLFLVVRDPLNAEPGNSSIGPTLRDALSRLQRWGAEPATPFALWLLKQVSEKKADEADATRSVEMLLSFLLRRALAGIPTNLLNRLLTPVAHELERRDPGVPVSVELARTLGKKGYYWPSDPEVLSAVGGQPLYISAKRNVRFILSEAEQLLPGMERADTRDTQIDHVMPQSLPEEWRDYLRDAGIEIDDAQALLHTLGNLTLTENNPEMGNALFEKKKAEFYADSALRLNRDLATLSAFLPDDIRERGRRLATLILNRYPGPEAGSADPSAGDPDATGASVEDRLEAALQAMPDGAWTTEDDLVTYLGAGLEEVRAAINGLSAVLIRLVREPDRSTPEWISDSIRAEVIKQGPPPESLGEHQNTEALRKLASQVEAVTADQDDSDELVDES